MNTIPVTSRHLLQHWTTLILQYLLLLMVATSSIQLANAKDRIRYHITGPDGSTLRTVDEQGVTVAAYRYSPFGEQLQSKKPANLKDQVGFVGGIHEQPDLVYLKQRYYNPTIGRFYQPDPVTFLQGGTGQINRYQYGWNDPFTFKDPSGQYGEYTEDELGNITIYIPVNFKEAGVGGALSENPGKISEWVQGIEYYISGKYNGKNIKTVVDINPQGKDYRDINNISVQWGFEKFGGCPKLAGGDCRPRMTGGDIWNKGFFYNDTNGVVAAHELGGHGLGIYFDPSEVVDGFSRPWQGWEGDIMGESIPRNKVTDMSWKIIFRPNNPAFFKRTDPPN